MSKTDRKLGVPAPWSAPPEPQQTPLRPLQAVVLLCLLRSRSAADMLLKSAKVSKVKTLFADDAEYITKVSRYSKKMAEKADSVVLSETLGSNIDLTL